MGANSFKRVHITYMNTSKYSVCAGTDNFEEPFILIVLLKTHLNHQQYTEIFSLKFKINFIFYCIGSFSWFHSSYMMYMFLSQESWFSWICYFQIKTSVYSRQCHYHLNNLLLNSEVYFKFFVYVASFYEQKYSEWSIFRASYWHLVILSSLFYPPLTLIFPSF